MGILLTPLIINSSNFKKGWKITVRLWKPDEVIISTVSRVTVEEGGSISIPCFYELTYTDHVKYLCKGCTWDDCTNEIKTDWENSTKYSISDNKNQRMVTFIINDLKTEDSNCYWCSAEKTFADDKTDFHLHVGNQGKTFETATVHMHSNVELSTIATTTTTATTTIQPTTISSTSKPVNHTYVSQEPTTEQTGTHRLVRFKPVFYRFIHMINKTALLFIDRIRTTDVLMIRKKTECQCGTD
uniref:Ig-like domain-containing protein n=1 Tax=Sphaeramia orbicularis TaxID=375764 RepID=A0A673CJP7_9TELE